MMSKQERYKFYRSKEWESVRQQALERDNYECVECAKQGKVTSQQHNSKLDVDHIYDLEHYPNLKLNMENLQVLCLYHHNLKHNRFVGKQKKKNKWADDEWW